MTARLRQPPRAPVLVRSEHPKGAYAARVLRTYAQRFLPALPRAGELSIVVSTDRAIRLLNRDFRAKDKATDVLSFGQADGPLLGDVVISLDTARRQAKEGARPLTDELARLLAHGLLHLCGHDHERDADARAMSKAEVKLLGRVGLVGEALGHPKDLEFARARRATHPGRASVARRPTETMP